MSFFLAFTIVHFVGALVLVALMIYAELAKLQELESYFSENEHLRRNKRFWKRNYRIGRLHRMVLIMDMLSMPKVYLKKGLVTEAELASVPLALKRWATWPYCIGYIWAVLTCVWQVWFKWWPEWT